MYVNPFTKSITATFDYQMQVLWQTNVIKVKLERQIEKRQATRRDWHND